mmetsp:Transcript_88476/g.250791  ORF Transcript_88476/g.250791 Transcript_88476/m.250791 type:complete len:285 (+) Transcript_88476:140-994(+)
MPPARATADDPKAEKAEEQEGSANGQAGGEALLAAPLLLRGCRRRGRSRRACRGHVAAAGVDHELHARDDRGRDARRDGRRRGEPLRSEGAEEARARGAAIGRDVAGPLHQPCACGAAVRDQLVGELELPCGLQLPGGAAQGSGEPPRCARYPARGAEYLLRGEAEGPGKDALEGLLRWAGRQRHGEGAQDRVDDHRGGVGGAADAHRDAPDLARPTEETAGGHLAGTTHGLARPSLGHGGWAGGATPAYGHGARSAAGCGTCGRGRGGGCFRGGVPRGRYGSG